MSEKKEVMLRKLPTNVEAAYKRIKSLIYKTPLMFSEQISLQTGANVFLKLESEQVAGSFKIRGAFNKILLLKERAPENLSKGIVTASTGNHGIACMHAAKTCGCSVEVFCQENVSQSKLETLLLYGANISRYGKDCVDAELKARQTAMERGQIYMSPYNDWDVMAGQGTVGYEIYSELPEVDFVLASVGGGGLIGGTAAYLKTRNPNIKVIGCQPRNSKVMFKSVKAGHIQHEPSYDTLSDGTAGDIEDESMSEENDLQLEQLPREVDAAYERIKPFIYRTPLMFSKQISLQTGANVFLKLESEQVTGSFKIRGAFNKFLLLKEREPENLSKGVVTASSGNYGKLHAGNTFGCSVEVYCNENISKSKMETLLFNGAKVSHHGKDCVDAEFKARQTAKERGRIYLSPYNDWDSMAGQGTVGYEIYSELPETDFVLASVGGGGLIGGIAGFFKAKNPKVQVIGCQPRNSKVMFESVKAGYIKNELSYDTLSDGTSGGIEDGSITFSVCSKFVDDWILVDEQQISDAVFFVLDKHQKVIEGSAGVVVAALQSQKDRFKGKNVALVICGGNISSETLQSILNSHIKTE